MRRQTGDQRDRLSSAVKTRDISRRGGKKIPGQRAGEEFTETNTLVFDGQFIRHTDTRLTHGFDYLRNARFFNAGTQQLALVHESSTMDVHLAKKRMEETYLSL
jgi:hypothetical protein